MLHVNVWNNVKLLDKGYIWWLGGFRYKGIWLGVSVNRNHDMLGVYLAYISNSAF